MYICIYVSLPHSASQAHRIGEANFRGFNTRGNSRAVPAGPIAPDDDDDDDDSDDNDDDDDDDDDDIDDDDDDDDFDDDGDDDDDDDDVYLNYNERCYRIYGPNT
jgi:hypothetical protein